MGKARRRNKRKNKKENGKGSLTQKERQNNLARMIEKYKCVESSRQSSRIEVTKSSIDEKALRKRGIKPKDPHITNRCVNCVYYIGFKCTYHNIEVTENHSCYKFRGYEILHGGNFSPR